jgi:hypothetical protein
LDNSKVYNPFWQKVAHWYFHVPELKNVSQMFNFFLDNHPADDLFYADDDNEYHPEIRKIMEKYLKCGFDLVLNPKMYVSHNDKAALFLRKPRNVGSCWMVSKDVLRLARFNETTIEGVCDYLKSLIDDFKVNYKTIYYPLVNLLLHDRNMVLKNKNFDLVLPKPDWSA